ncbi:hypothetical protein NS226_13625 [Aureimonas ureilytica]|uniref:Uncharacterized protein n=1 Tax=Aureimonas ureilytica TaxID=401562 RepID=A0A175R903_9HYPH|nr:hypothetical protein NS226_13625 [Aureimonas ureilytica]
MVTVADDDMRVGVVSVLASGMERRQPTGPLLRDGLRKIADQINLLRRGQLARQRHHDLVDNPGIGPVPRLNVAEVFGGLCRIIRQMLGHKNR